MIDEKTLTQPVTYNHIYDAYLHAKAWSEDYPQLLNFFTTPDYTWISGGVCGKGSAHANVNCRIVKQAGYTIETGTIVQRAWVTGRRTEHCTGEGYHWLEPAKVKVVNAICEIRQILQPLYTADQLTSHWRAETAPADDKALTSGQLDALIGVLEDACQDADADPALFAALTLISAETARWKDLSQRAKERMAALLGAAAKKTASVLGWPELTGTPKQCDWAETIREQLYDAGDEQCGERIFGTESRASAWIALRHTNPADLDDEWQQMLAREQERQRWEDQRDAESWRFHTGQTRRRSQSNSRYGGEATVASRDGYSDQWMEL